MKRALAFVVLTSVSLLGRAQTTGGNPQGGCYGQGPTMTCYESGKPMVVHKSFRHSDGHDYTWGRSGYCYLNEYGKERCMQAFEANQLRCTESGGSLACQ